MTSKTSNAQPRNVAILVFDNVEVLDFCGPFEVFSVAGRRDGIEPFNVFVVSQTGDAVSARNQLSINPRYSLADCPRIDILVVPGGYGTRAQLKNSIILDWIRKTSLVTEYLLSVCTGALLLGKAGLLNGLKATTHHMAFDELRKAAPNTEILENERIVDNGSVILSAGVAAGIDMSLHVVGKILGTDKAAETAKYIEYPWSQDLRVG